MPSWAQQKSVDYRHNLCYVCMEPDYTRDRLLTQTHFANPMCKGIFVIILPFCNNITPRLYATLAEPLKIWHLVFSYSAFRHSGIGVIRGHTSTSREPRKSACLLCVVWLRLSSYFPNNFRPTVYC